MDVCRADREMIHHEDGILADILRTDTEKSNMLHDLTKYNQLGWESYCRCKKGLCIEQESMLMHCIRNLVQRQTPLAKWLGLRFQSSESWVHIPPSEPVHMYWLVAGG
jgi:hypothetical protein